MSFKEKLAKFTDRNLLEMAIQKSFINHINKTINSKCEIIRWSPVGLDADDIMRIIQNYGTENDSLMAEEYDENKVSWKINISVEKYIK